MKKVLLLTHEYYPFAGGVATYCYNLFKNFSTDKYIVLTDCLQVQSSGNIINKRLIAPYFWPRWFYGLLLVMSLVKKYKIEIIFTPNILPLGSIAYFIKKIFGLPYVISLHGLDINLALKNKSALTKKILTNAQAVICNTKYTADLAKDLVPADKIHVIYPSTTLSSEAVGIEKINSLKEKYNITDEKVILTVGRLVVRKGHSLVIKSLEQLKDLKIKYFIVGTGPEFVNLERQIKEAGLESRVFLLDKVSNDELNSFYQLADVFVMPNQSLGTDIEGFGIVFLEAASYSLPIIAGSSGGVQEIFTGQGDVIYADDELAIRRALRDFVSDEQKRLTYGKQAHLRSEYFKKVSLENINLLENILS